LWAVDNKHNGRDSNRILLDAKDRSRCSSRVAQRDGRNLLSVIALPGTCGGALYSTSTPTVLSYSSQGRARCRWAIDAPSGEHVEINVTSVNLPPDATGACISDHLELRDQPLVWRLYRALLYSSNKIAHSNLGTGRVATPSGRPARGSREQ